MSPSLALGSSSGHARATRKSSVAVSVPENMLQACTLHANGPSHCPVSTSPYVVVESERMRTAVPSQISRHWNPTWAGVPPKSSENVKPPSPKLLCHDEPELVSALCCVGPEMAEGQMAVGTSSVCSLHSPSGSALAVSKLFLHPTRVSPAGHDGHFMHWAGVQRSVGLREVG